MWIKASGAVMIMIAALLWGNRQALRLERRVVELEEFRLALRLLVAEIGYTATPLPRALENMASRLQKPEVRAFFNAVRTALGESEQVYEASTAWSLAAARTKNILNLTTEDWGALRRAAAGLGGLGQENQVKQLEMAEAQLAALSAGAAAASQNGGKMWRYLGMLGGLAVVILFL